MKENFLMKEEGQQIERKKKKLYHSVMTSCPILRFSSSMGAKITSEES